MRKVRFGILLSIMCMLCSEVIAQSQFVIQHQPPPTINKTNPAQLEFVVPGLTQGELLLANVFYRFEGDFSYTQQELTLVNGSFFFVPPLQNSNSSRIEYYFQLTTIENLDYFSPSNLPSENPYQAEIISKEESPKEVRPRLEGIDYTLISPDDNSVLALNDVFIAIALYYDVNTIPEGEFKLFIDDRDVTQNTDYSPYYISYVPKDLRIGRHTARFEYVTDVESFLVVEWNFTVVNPNQINQFAVFGESNMPTGQLELTARNQVISGDINDALTGRTSVSGRYKNFRYSLAGFFTTQESNRLQPQNRFSADLNLGNWWNLQAGHVFPMMGDFTISGRRVYGINTSLKLADERFTAQFVTGEVNRKIENLYAGIQVTEQTFNNQVVDTTYALQFQDFGKGTFSRKIMAGRLGIGNERKFQMGFQVMKVEDDTSSIFNATNFTELLTGNPSLTQNLSAVNFQKLNENPDLLQIQTGAVQPRGNFVLSTDMKAGFDDNRIRLKSEGAISALNNNIYDGSLTVERASDLGFDISEEDADLLERLSRIIIVNENMSVLPIRVKNFNTDSSDAELYFPTNLLASNSELNFNYPKNNLKVQYRWIGPDFNSLANTTIRKDIAGFTLSDRFRLVDNRVYVTLGLESLRDNVANQRDATTRTNTYRTNVSWYPITQSLPRITTGIRYRTRDNGIDLFNPNVPIEFQNAAVQNLSISGTDTLLTSNARQNTTIDLSSSISQQFDWLGILHDASLSISNLMTNDQVFRYGDVKSTSFSLNLNSRFTDYDLRTQLGITLNNTETGGGQNEIKIFGLYTGGSYFLLNRKLNLNGRLALTNNKSTFRNLIVEPNSAADNDPLNDYFILEEESTSSKFGTFIFQLGAQYEIDPNHALVFDSSFTNVSGVNNANDRVIQLRYILRF